jgi:phosphopentomutase
MLNRMHDGDVAMFVADHGVDPTTPSTDHSREYAPLLVFGAPVRPGTNLGTRGTFSDVAATIAGTFSLTAPLWGESFLPDILLKG